MCGAPGVSIRISSLDSSFSYDESKMGASGPSSSFSLNSSELSVKFVVTESPFSRMMSSMLTLVS